jgi:hypothetical protein
MTATSDKFMHSFDMWVKNDIAPYTHMPATTSALLIEDNASRLTSHFSKTAVTLQNFHDSPILSEQNNIENFQKNSASDLRASIRKVQAPLDLLIGPSDERFPSECDVVALDFPEDVWLHHLFLPDRDWHALTNAGVVLRLMIPFGHRLAAGISRLAQRFPQTKFLIDAFRHGPNSRSNWQAQVCLADHENVWISTLGMIPGPAFCWPEQTHINEALYFTVGEVGAGKLLFASGQTLEDAQNFDAENWLEHVPFLDPAQRELIRNENAWYLF